MRLGDLVTDGGVFGPCTSPITQRYRTFDYFNLYHIPRVYEPEFRARRYVLPRELLRGH